MWTIVLGPTFETDLARPAERAAEDLAEWVREGRCPFHAIRAGNHFTITPHAGSRHFWSPVLTLELREEDGRALASGRFNPGPGIWTGYMLTYLSLMTISLGAAMWGAAELMLGRTPWALGLIPACAVVGALMLWASWIGQRLARAEMDAIREAVERALMAQASAAPSSAVAGVGPLVI